jgi:hypothetical protein
MVGCAYLTTHKKIFYLFGGHKMERLRFNSMVALEQYTKGIQSIEVWWNPESRLWTIQDLDEDRNQVGHAEYLPNMHQVSQYARMMQHLGIRIVKLFKNGVEETNVWYPQHPLLRRNEPHTRDKVGFHAAIVEEAEYDGHQSDITYRTRELRVGLMNWTACDERCKNHDYYIFEGRGVN